MLSVLCEICSSLIMHELCRHMPIIMVNALWEAHACNTTHIVNVLCKRKKRQASTHMACTVWDSSLLPSTLCAYPLETQGCNAALIVHIVWKVQSFTSALTVNILCETDNCKLAPRGDKSFSTRTYSICTMVSWFLLPQIHSKCTLWDWKQKACRHNAYTMWDVCP